MLPQGYRIGGQRPHHRDRGSIYPGTCRPVNPVIRFGAVENSAWRYRIDAGLQWGNIVRFEDEVIGPQTQNLIDDVGDFVVKRRDGLFAYQLASVIDDGLLRVTDVVRGEDLSESTGRQIALFNALDLPIPRFWHLPLMRDASQQVLSKRDDAQSIDPWRDRPPEVLVGQLAWSIGLSDTDTPISCVRLQQTLTPESFVQRLRQTFR